MVRSASVATGAVPAKQYCGAVRADSDLVCLTIIWSVVSHTTQVKLGVSMRSVRRFSLKRVMSAQDPFAR